MVSLKTTASILTVMKSFFVARLILLLVDQGLTPTEAEKRDSMHLMEQLATANQPSDPMAPPEEGHYTVSLGKFLQNFLLISLRT